MGRVPIFLLARPSPVTVSWALVRTFAPYVPVVYQHLYVWGPCKHETPRLPRRTSRRCRCRRRRLATARFAIDAKRPSCCIVHRYLSHLRCARASDSTSTPLLRTCLHPNCYQDRAFPVGNELNSVASRTLIDLSQACPSRPTNRMYGHWSRESPHGHITPNIAGPNPHAHSWRKARSSASSRRRARRHARHSQLCLGEPGREAEELDDFRTASR
jgi:hypothetical protein